MSFRKNLNKLFSEPPEMRIGEIRNILANFGYAESRIRGSHHIFTKRDCDTIIVPSHNNKVRKPYIKDIKNVIINML